MRRKETGKSGEGVEWKNEVAHYPSQNVGFVLGKRSCRKKIGVSAPVFLQTCTITREHIYALDSSMIPSGIEMLVQTLQNSREFQSL